MMSFLKNKFQDENEYVVFDTETTGLDIKKDEIISIGAIKVKDNKILLHDSFHLFIKPSINLKQKNVSIHQIRDCDLENALSLNDAIIKFLEFIGSLPLVGYYLEFDVAMVNKGIKALTGSKLKNKQIEVSGLYYEKKIKSITQGKIDLSFEAIIKDLNIPRLKAHDALNDAIMTAFMFLKLQKQNKLKR